MRFGVRGSQAKRLLEMTNGRVDLTDADQHAAEIVVGFGVVRSGLNRVLVVPPRLGDPAFCEPQVAEIVVRQRVGGID